jgi:cysteine desulfurase/selenocysteine lyase
MIYPMFDTKKIKKDFPILKRKIHGKPLVYLDNAATTQKPQSVIDAEVNYYKYHNANVHRGIHTLAEEATTLYEKARVKLAKFIGAKNEKEIIFVKNSTEAINLVAYSWGRSNLNAGDEVIVSEAEHHSNLVPWQIIAQEKRAKLKFAPLENDGRLSLDKLSHLLTNKTKIISLTHISNVLGVINPIGKVATLAHKRGALLLVDGSQSAPRMPIDVALLGCDFFVLTGHKMLGPTGIGVLWGRQAILKDMPPFLGGGEMIKEVYFDHFTVNDLPYKFEAGTPNIAGAIGLGAAVDYLTKLGMENVFTHERKLTEYAIDKLSAVANLTIYGPKDSQEKVGVVAFNLKGIHAHDLAQSLDAYAIAIRSGHHCAMPLHRNRLHIPASARISFCVYNDKNDIDILVEAINKAKKLFNG